MTLAPTGVDLWFAPRAVQTLSALRTTICCQCCRFAEQIQEPLCDIFQSVHTSPLAACRNAWGGKNSLRSNIMPPASKHCSATRCASQRCPLDKLLMLAAKSQTSLDFARLHVTFRPWRGITFAIKSHNSRILLRKTVISKKTGTVKGHNLKPVDFWIK